RNLRERYEIKTIRRKNIFELPMDALREAVTNALCHRDYFEQGARVMVEIFDDRVEITNPGGVPKGITKDNFGSVSVARNPVIASLLHRAHYIERMGTGIRRMTAAMETAGLETPVFHTEGYFFKVVFKRELLHTDTNAGMNGVIDGVIDGVNGVNGANEKQAILIDLITKNGKITIPQMSQESGFSVRQTQRELKQLTEKGTVLRIGGRRNGYWQVSLKE
ncbi:MAG: hypothetical protein FWD21_04420, partial [Peptococcaceae bacterium]|nr:hypothetical protein [Peptococcaceae bacterium]